MKKLILILVCIGLLFCWSNSFAQDIVNVHGWSIDDSTYDSTDAANYWTVVTTGTDASETYTTFKFYYFTTFVNVAGKSAAESIRVVIYPLISYDGTYWISLRATDSLYVNKDSTQVKTLFFVKDWAFHRAPYLKFNAIGISGNDSARVAIKQLFSQ